LKQPIGERPAVTTSSLRWFLRDDSGATAIEYGLIAALVCVAAIGALNAFAEETNNMYQYVVDAMQGTMP
jgi:pilus assembly protein Flp/PilA